MQAEYRQRREQLNELEALMKVVIVAESAVVQLPENCCKSQKTTLMSER
jgi:hypothetical protein